MLGVSLLVAAITYLFGVVAVYRRGGWWPAGRPAYWLAGAQLMYYRGDLIHLALIVAFCRQWYRATDPARRSATVVPRINTARPLRRPWRSPEEFRTADGRAGAGS